MKSVISKISFYAFIQIFFSSLAYLNHHSHPPLCLFYLFELKNKDFYNNFNLTCD